MIEQLKVRNIISSLFPQFISGPADSTGQEPSGKPGKGVKRKQPGGAPALPPSVTPVLSTLPKPADGKKKGNDSLGLAQCS